MQLERRQIIGIAVSVVILALLAIWFLRSPSNERDWTMESETLSWGTVANRTVTIHNLRDTVWHTTTAGDLTWRDETYDLDTLTSVEYMVEDLEEFPGFAHTMLTFGFSDKRHVAISVEIRKEEGESYSPIRGMLRSYELRYVIGTERDLLGLRTHRRNHTVYLYPIRATPRQRETLFLDMLARADALRTTPEYYNTFTSTCTTNLVRHANTVTPGRVPWDYRIILPEFSDEMAYELGLIDTDLNWSDVRAAYRIDEKARMGGLDERYSARIRGINETLPETIPEPRMPHISVGMLRSRTEENGFMVLLTGKGFWRKWTDVQNETALDFERPVSWLLSAGGTDGVKKALVAVQPVAPNITLLCVKNVTEEPYTVDAYALEPAWGAIYYIRNIDAASDDVEVLEQPTGEPCIDVRTLRYSIRANCEQISESACGSFGRGFSTRTQCLDRKALLANATCD